MQKKDNIDTDYRKKHSKYDRFYGLLEIKPTRVYKKSPKNTKKIDLLKNKNLNTKEEKISYMIMVHEVDAQLNLLIKSLLSDVGSIEGVYAVVMHGGLFVKRISRTANGDFLVQSDNPAYQSATFPADQVSLGSPDGHAMTIIGRVVWTMQRV